MPAFPAGTPCWADISVPDTDRATAFYSAVLGWQVSEGQADFGGYATARAHGAAVAGIGPMMGVPVTAWTLYFASDDAARTQDAITRSGGTIEMPVHAVADVGQLVIARDPTGAVFGVWQAGTMVGFESVGTPGAFAWCDLRSTDPDLARAFYADVFDYHYTGIPMAGPEYATFALAADGPPVGGIGPMMGAPIGVPPHWLVYFAVDDADGAARAASAHGGTTIGDPFDSPFGRMAPLTDPFGAPFWAVQLGN